MKKYRIIVEVVEDDYGPALALELQDIKNFVKRVMEEEGGVDVIKVEVEDIP